mmetsp:Transcript_114872/g.225392  ORF Transcript_114872/g.225392 Transcript_114872/m.225392 type:complete len:278 (+) Transcript_114872:68-901(+)
MTLGGALLAMFACGRPRACPNTRTLVAAELPNGAYAEIQRGLVEYRDDVPVPQGDGNITEHTPAPCGPSCSPTIPDLVMGLCVFETEWACPPIKLLPTDRDLEDNHDSFCHRTRYRLTMLIMTTVGVRILSQGAAVCCSGFRKAFRSENETDTAKDKWYFAASTAVTFSTIYCAVVASILTLAWYTDGLSATSGLLSEAKYGFVADDNFRAAVPAVVNEAQCTYPSGSCIGAFRLPSPKMGLRNKCVRALNTWGKRGFDKAMLHPVLRERVGLAVKY